LKDISHFKKFYEKIIAKKFCDIEDISLCKNKDQCTCRIAAEVKSFMRVIIPDQYFKLNIDDFTGKHNNKRLLSDDLAVKAKEQIIKYCWGDISLDSFNLKSKEDRDNISVMDQRRSNGTNVVIYSDDKNSKGKTFVASLVMKEAIKRRTKVGNYVQTYDWLSFSMIGYNMKKDDSKLNHARSADWLVIDDIPASMSTRQADSYMSSLINPFFYERHEDGLPTIFVFRFDISDKFWNIEEKYGIAISKIVEDPKTFKIALCEREVPDEK